MRYWNYLLSFFALWLLAGSVAAQPAQKDVAHQMQQFRINRSLYFNYDLYRFAAEAPDSGQIFVVVSFVNDLLQFVKKSDSLYQASAELTFTVLDTQKNLMGTQTYRRRIAARAFGQTNSRGIVHTYFCRFLLPAGKYILRLELTDLEIRKSLHRQEKFEIPEYQVAPIQLSDPVLTLSGPSPQTLVLQPLDQSYSPPPGFPLRAGAALLSPFPVDQLKHYRVPDSVRVYIEAYSGRGAHDSLHVTFTLLDAKNNAIWTETRGAALSAARVYPVSYRLNFGDKKPGLYFLQITAKAGAKSRTRQVRMFYPGHLRRTAETSGELDEFGPLRYIVEESQYRQWEEADSARRDSLIAAFWKERDPTPGTPENELREEFLKRVAFANANFVSLIKNRPGWQTDQGRVYIVYGPPNDIIHPAITRGNYRHEIWIYGRSPKQLTFIFRFDPETGEYRLLRTER